MSDVIHKPTFGERLGATGLHLAFSSMLLGIGLYLVFGLWYPAPLDRAVGVGRIYLLMLAADFLLGPLLTFIVFKKDRWRLLFDLAIILLLQVSAFAYGLFTVAQGRPVWLAFVVDDFELVSPAEIDRRQEVNFAADYRESFWQGPRWVAALYSDDPKLRESQREDEMFLGVSLAQRPETYAPLFVRRDQVLAKARELGELGKYSFAQQVRDILSKWPNAKAWLPLKAGEEDMVVLLGESANILAVVDLRPW